MDAVGGDLAGHDHEFEQVRWITFAEAGSMLSFETERALVARAAEAIGEVESSGGGRPGQAAR
jgi:hypothetical protein